MKKTTLKKTCIGVVALVPFTCLISVIVVSTLALFVFQACTFLLYDVIKSPDVQPTGVAFFESGGGWDYIRIPLIEPYQALSADEKTWSISLKTDSYRYQFSIDISELDVINSRFIATYCANCTLDGVQVDERWFIIIPEENIEIGFTKEEEFLTYLEDKGIDNPNLTDVNELYDEFVDKGYLEWFPEEYKE
jgi:hypothetical protein